MIWFTYMFDLLTIRLVVVVEAKEVLLLNQEVEVVVVLHQA
jgi:hypothetical protein